MTKLRTKSQIKVDRFISNFIGLISLIGIGYNLALQNILSLSFFLCFIGMFFLIRVDKCNNDLEYGRFVK